MTDNRNHLKDLLVGLAAEGVDFIVCGGVAAILHGVPRVTLDLDISVEWSVSNLRKFIHAMDRLKLRPKVPVPPEALLDPVVVRAMVEQKRALVFTFLDPEDPLRHVDVFLVKDLSYEALIEHAEVRDLEGYPVRVLSARHLLMLKERIDPPRDRDILDIKALRKIIEQSTD